MATITVRTSRYSGQVESLIEAFVGLGILMGINLAFFPEDPGYLTVNPHPFLFLTILIASRYGTFDGLVTGLLSAAVYMAYLFFGRDFSAVIKTFEWSDLIPAYLFVIMGLLLGEIREIANREVLRMTGEVKTLRSRLADLSRDNETLTTVKEELQQRVLSSDDPLREFYSSARKLSTLHPDEAYPAIMDLVARFTGAEKFSIYLAEQDASGNAVFRMKISRGWSAPDEFDTSLTRGHPAVSRTLERREVTVLKDSAEGKQFDILACAPLQGSDPDDILGLIVIHRIPFVRLTRMTVSHLQTIAGWAGKTLEDARRYDSAMDSRVDDERTGTYNFRFLSLRLAEEAQRVRRYGGHCSYLLVKVLDVESLSPEDRRTFLQEMGQTLKRLLRTVDLVGVHRVPGSFGLILPFTTPSQARVVTARVNEAFRRAFTGYGSRYAHLRMKMGLSSTTDREPLSEQRMMEEAERFDLGHGIG
jgi:GGDEF domain-containing protein